jgi:membrane protease YdiL (CAAX protease family)
MVMCPERSSPPPPLRPAVAVALALLGAGALVVGGALLGPRLGLGLRAQIALGSLLLALPCVVAVPLARPGTWRNVLGLGPLASSPLVLSALLGGALWVASIGLMELQSMVLPPPPEYLDAFRAIHAALAPDGVLDALVSVTVIALLPGAGEELVMRGVLLPALVAPLGSVAAVGGSALLFASIHLDPYRFAFTLAIGVVLGVVRLRTGSLWPPILAHVTLNTLTFLVAPLVDDPTQTTYTPQPILGLACLLVGTALVVPLLKALPRSVDSPRTPA